MNLKKSHIRVNSITDFNVENRKNNFYYSLILCFVLLLFGLTLKAISQTSDKPRFLKHSTPLCPININKMLSKEGLFRGNRETINIDTTKTSVETKEDIVDEDGKVVVKKGGKIPSERYDTVLLRSVLIESGFAFDIVTQVGSYSILKFWPSKDQKGTSLFNYIKNNSAINEVGSTTFPSFEDLQVEGLKLVTSSYKYKGKDSVLYDSVVYDLSKAHFIVPTQILINNSKEFENKNNTWNIGLLVLPVKIRPFATEGGQFDFSDGFSVGTTFSLTVHHNWRNGFTHNLLLFAGVSSFTADSSKIKEVRNDYKIPAFSPAIGWMWERNGVQLSILIGMDFPAGNLQKKWVYRNKPWLGLGLGISLFKISNNESTSKGENK